MKNVISLKDYQYVAQGEYGIDLSSFTGSFEPIEKASEGDIIKSDVRGAIRYGELGQNKFTKTGKELKMLIEAAKADNEAKIAELNAKMSQLCELIGEDPSEEYWDNKNLKRYSYNMVYSDYDNSPVYTYDNDKAKKAAMRMYNDMIYNVSNCLREIDAIDSALEEIQDEDKYTISLRGMMDLKSKENNY